MRGRRVSVAVDLLFRHVDREVLMLTRHSFYISTQELTSQYVQQQGTNNMFVVVIFIIFVKTAIVDIFMRTMYEVAVCSHSQHVKHSWRSGCSDEAANNTFILFAWSHFSQYFGITVCKQCDKVDGFAPGDDPPENHQLISCSSARRDFQLVKDWRYTATVKADS